MKDELQEIGKLWGSLDDIENYSYRKGQQKEPENFQRLKQDFSEVEDLNKLKTLLLMLGEKKGTEVTQKFESRESLEEFTEFLSEQGFYVWTGIGLEEDTFVYAEVFVNHEAYPEDFFDKYQDMREKKPEKYHRRMGGFFGYPEDCITAFISKPSLKERIRNFIARYTSLSMKRSSIAGPEEAIKKYGGDLSSGQKRDFRTLIFYMLADSEESFDQALKTAEARRESIEKLRDEEGLDFTYLQENYLEMLDSFGN